ncbi:hypothetical protein Daesc_006979 [Daldinia eschscholtzii]|uniref:Xylanolytic transcriptional activator regulatory domain-containing protein n=1 Tax=Daldinia eschscholtzii TaxID=292717 RepID=A0AAX6MJU0_9PEZI
MTSGYIGEDATEYGDNVSRLADRILSNPSSQIVITLNLDLEQFCELFGGENLRLETLGLLYTTAARCYLCAYENIQLMMLVEGDASLSVWRRFGDLVTDLFALGLHREALYSAETVPFFLSECRRKIFVSAYYIDKVFVLVFNRPPRIPTRHADCKPPFDLSEDELFAASPAVLEQARSRLSPDGWSTDGKCKTTTWARIRYILARFREEIAEYQFQSGNIELLEIKLAIGGVPYAWEGPELIEVSKNMLETVVQMANAQIRVFCYPHSIPTIILYYGVPSASILTSALLDITRNPSRTLPLGINGSLLIRNLSVLVSHLESATSPGETNHEFCMQAAKLISRNLDQILSGFTASSITTPSNPAQEPNDSSDTWTAGIGDLDSISFADFNSLDFETWVMDINLNTINSEWNI